MARQTIRWAILCLGLLVVWGGQVLLPLAARRVPEAAGRAMARPSPPARPHRDRHPIAVEPSADAPPQAVAPASTALPAMEAEVAAPGGPQRVTLHVHQTPLPLVLRTIATQTGTVWTDRAGTQAAAGTLDLDKVTAAPA